MTRSLVYKLTLAFVLVALISAAIVMVFIRFTNLVRLYNLILNQARSDLVESLTSYYQENGSWEGVQSVWASERPWIAVPDFDPANPNQDFASRPNDRRRMFALVDANGRVILGVQNEYLQGALVPTRLLERNGTPIEVNGQRVGTLLSANRAPPLTPEETYFLQRTNQALMIGAGVAVLVAMLVGIYLARTLTRPLQALTRATQKIAEGNLEQQVEVKSQDEIGQLAQSFNRMSQEVARANLTRRQMTADIAHDLRTPLTVISGYVESMRDGVLQPTEQRLALIYTEIERLQKLIDDLRLLSLADAGKLPVNPQPLAPLAILERASAPHQHRAAQQGVSLTLQAPGGLQDVAADEARMMQVFDNLIINALRYTPQGGQITLAAQTGGEDAVVLSIQDTGSGIPAQDLDRVFERFYRSDPSRAAENGESGLGLAIVKALVEAQGGKVWAESKPGMGTKISMRLPIATTA
jgi:signal transduction histidine kinase